MIPLNIYQTKIADLHFVLTEMGAEPHVLQAWLFNEHNKGDLQLAKAKASAYASLALVQSMPKFSGASILGLRLTESKAAQKRADVLSDNQNLLYEEINQLESIHASLYNLLGMVQNRLYAVRRVRDSLSSRIQSGGKEAAEMEGQVAFIDKSVAPLLKALLSELQKALATCAKDISTRKAQIEIIDKQQLALPKYSRKVRRRRLARHKKKMAAEAAAKAAADAAKKPEDGAGGA